ncbi:MAG: domain containing protein [Candidatus Solibacter sp.]|nr:domain containing protein [Candidatus Solibacter sp.]
MAHSGTVQPRPRISGQIIIDELIRNMELGRLELGYSILVPCIFSVYLHPDDFTRVISVENLIKEDAKRALTARMAEWNAKGGGGLLRRNAQRKVYKIASNTWWIGLFADSESTVPPGDVEIHSELNDAAQPGYRGTKTTLIDRAPSVTSARVARDRENTRMRSAPIFAEIRYHDDSGPQTYLVTQNEITIGRGGDDLWVDLALYGTDEISREHLRLRRDPASGDFKITDLSRNGTWINGRRIAGNVEMPVPERAEISLSEVIKLTFELRHD